MSVEKRFLAKVKPAGTMECWEWVGAKCKQGYGQFSLKGRTQKAHRVSYGLWCHQLPPSSQVLHRCDNPSCVNPGHLFLGTNDDNVADKMEKGRHACPRGQGHALAKLTEPNVLAIRQSEESGQATAARFGVSTTTISQIRTRKVWKHI